MSTQALPQPDMTAWLWWGHCWQLAPRAHKLWAAQLPCTRHRLKATRAVMGSLQARCRRCAQPPLAALLWSLRRQTGGGVLHAPSRCRSMVNAWALSSGCQVLEPAEPRVRRKHARAVTSPGPRHLQ